MPDKAPISRLSNLYCQYTRNCPFYAHWSQATGLSRTDILALEASDEEPGYRCLAISSIRNGDEHGIPLGKDLARQLLEDPESLGRISCHLKHLNNPNYLDTKILHLVSSLKKTKLK